MIRTKHGTYDGDSWEEHCQLLLKKKYDSEGYQEMVAHTKGDHGIEGYTRTGIVFQCYCPDEGYEPGKLYEEQRDKVTGDLRKLKKNKEKLKDFLGDTKIKQWIFLTPLITNKELIRHCRSKADEYRSMDDMGDLLDPEFDVLAKDEGYFIEELMWVKLFLANKMIINVDTPETSEIIDWKNCESKAIKTLYDKLGEIFNGHADQDKKTNMLVDSMVKNHIVGIKVLNLLQEDFSMLFEKQFRIKASVESSLETENLLTTLLPSEYLRKTMNDYKDALKAENFDSIFEYGVVDDLCREAVADWLIRCPLNFGGV